MNFNLLRSVANSIHFDPSEKTEEPKTDGKMTLDQAIEKALAGNEEPEKEKKAEPKAEPKKADEDDKEQKKETPKEDDLTDEQKSHALNLFKALINPETARETAAVLAKTYGITEDSTKKEIKETVKSLEDLVKESLGEEYSFLSEKLTPVLKQLEANMTKSVEALNKKLDDDKKLAAEQVENTKKEEAYSKLETDFTNVKEVEDTMLKLMDNVKMGKNTTYFDYYKSLYVLACNQQGIDIKRVSSSSKETTKVVNEDKLKKAKEDVEPTSVESKGKGFTPKDSKSVKEAVENAMQQLEEMSGKR